ncbi:hypothetical protein [Xanthomonas albilineans]|nr:hypothetical protein [Xanthomonas albilineans]
MSISLEEPSAREAHRSGERMVIFLQSFVTLHRNICIIQKSNREHA